MVPLIAGARINSYFSIHAATGSAYTVNKSYFHQNNTRRKLKPVRPSKTLQKQIYGEPSVVLWDPNKENTDTKMPTLRSCRLMWLHTPLRSAVPATQRKTKRELVSAAVLAVRKGGGWSQIRRQQKWQELLPTYIPSFFWLFSLHHSSCQHFKTVVGTSDCLYEFLTSLSYIWRSI